MNASVILMKSWMPMDSPALVSLVYKYIQACHILSHFKFIFFHIPYTRGVWPHSSTSWSELPSDYRQQWSPEG